MPEMNSTPQFTVLFDGNCSLCRASVKRVELFNRAGRVEFLDVHDPQALLRFPQIDKAEAMRSMQAISHSGNDEGRVYTGAEAWAHIGMVLPGWKLIAWILLLPGVQVLARRIYGWIARNRYRWNRKACEDGTCSVHIPESAQPTAKR